MYYESHVTVLWKLPPDIDGVHFRRTFQFPNLLEGSWVFISSWTIDPSRKVSPNSAGRIRDVLPSYNSRPTMTFFYER